MKAWYIKQAKLYTEKAKKAKEAGNLDEASYYENESKIYENKAAS